MSDLAQRIGAILENDSRDPQNKLLDIRAELEAEGVQVGVSKEREPGLADGDGSPPAEVEGSEDAPVGDGIEHAPPAE